MIISAAEFFQKDHLKAPAEMAEKKKSWSRTWIYSGKENENESLSAAN